MCIHTYICFIVFSEDGFSYCNTTWDDVSCWPTTLAGTFATVHCPKGVDQIDVTRKCWKGNIRYYIVLWPSLILFSSVDTWRRYAIYIFRKITKAFRASVVKRMLYDIHPIQILTNTIEWNHTKPTKLLLHTFLAGNEYFTVTFVPILDYD